MWISANLPAKHNLSNDLRVASFSSKAKLHLHRSGDRQFSVTYDAQAG
jgi:hypothetical protein